MFKRIRWVGGARAGLVDRRGGLLVVGGLEYRVNCATRNYASEYIYAGEKNGKYSTRPAFCSANGSE